MNQICANFEVDGICGWATGHADRACSRAGDSTDRSDYAAGVQHGSMNSAPVGENNPRRVPMSPQLFIERMRKCRFA